jgi:uncharacterized repeat protein (TIGR01451 family)
MMTSRAHRNRSLWLLLAVAVASGLLAAFSLALDNKALAAPIDPPEGYPKLIFSVKSVTPTLTYVGDQTLTYTIEIRNTGAYTAANVVLTDTLPVSVTYNDDGWASHGLTPTLVNSDTLQWQVTGL